MLNDGAGERMHWCGGCCVGGGASTCTVSFEKKKSTPTPQDTSIRPYSLPLMETSSEEELGGEEGGEEEEVEEEVERGRGEGSTCGGGRQGGRRSMKSSRRGAR